MAYAVVVTRTELGLADLDLNAWPRKAQREDFSAGEAAWRRWTADSPFVEGRVLVHAIRTQREAALPVYLFGDTVAEVNAARDELIAAVSQFSYTISRSLDGVALDAWDCEPADWQVRDTAILYGKRRLEVGLRIPCFPRPT